MQLRKSFIKIIGFLTSLLAASCPSAQAGQTNQQNQPSSSNQTNMINALHLDWMDQQIKPGENFYSYANGTWQKQNPIPPEYPSWGSFLVLHEKVQDMVHSIMMDAANNKKAVPGSIEQKVGDFYLSGMDEKTINQLGITPLSPEFETINQIKNLSDFEKTLAHLHLMGVDAVFNFFSMQDFKDSKKMIGAAVQGGLGLPDRDYYLKEDKQFIDIRQAYLKHIANTFQLLGDNAEQAQKKAQSIMSLETQLAQASLSQIEQRDPYSTYHFMSDKEIQKTNPNFSWEGYFKALGFPQIHSFNLAMPTFFTKVNELLKTIPLEDWKVYLHWHLASAFTPYLSQNFVDENFKMTAVLSGAQKLLPRWKRVVQEANSGLGFAVGKLYVERYFPPESKQQVVDILNNIRQALQKDLKDLSWMSQKTREQALKKLELMGERVGYPDKWWDYSSLVINRGPYVLNVRRANEFMVKRDLNKIGKPIDYSEWHMTPQMVNAYYNPSMNNINLPAGILQPPFFDPKAPAAVNYGAIGFVIGHEITHGFDDKGALFDGYGNLKNWWTEEDLKRFQVATKCIVDQFSGYKVNGDLSVQGELVVGEATADLGGLTLAYRALHDSKGFATAPTLQGLTPDQQFFLSAAHIWAGNIRPEQSRRLVTVDPHPPMIYRVNGTIANMPEFQSAFNLPKDSPMVIEARCVIW